MNLFDYLRAEYRPLTEEESSRRLFVFLGICFLSPLRYSGEGGGSR